MADTVEKLFQGVRADRLIRQQTEWSNNDSNAAPSIFYYCGNVILEPRSPDFSTVSTQVGRSDLLARTSVFRSGTGHPIAPIK
jgi:hypothetical protein